MDNEDSLIKQGQIWIRAKYGTTVKILEAPTDENPSVKFEENNKIKVMGLFYFKLHYIHYKKSNNITEEEGLTPPSE